MRPMDTWTRRVIASITEHLLIAYFVVSTVVVMTVERLLCGRDKSE